VPRKKTFQTLREAGKVGSYADMPMLPDDIQIQVYVSRNDRPQPFHLICAKDTLLFLLSGGGAVELKGTAADRFALKPGDCVYVPAGAPHRIVPDAESVMLRYKPQPAGLEGMAWYCGGCGAELHREVWDNDKTLSQDMYHRTSERFAADPHLRTCKGCGAVHPAPEFTSFRWDEVAKEIAASS
jgi:3-hydroxyanthranilate 3,4-dioxygenase